MNWTEEKIEEGIKKGMSALGINRMPTSQELRDNKMSGLGRAINNTGGLFYWQERLGLERKEREVLWTEKKISEEILKSTSLLNIKRMPTSSELISLGRNDIHCAISKSKKKYRGWAEYLNLALTDCNTRTGELYESKVKERLEGFGYSAEKMSSKFPYDLLINGKVKVDVKFGNTHHHFGCAGITFGINKPVQTSDIYILINFSNDNELETYYIIPSHLLKMKTLNIGIESKYNKYINAWHYLEKYIDFYDSIV